MTTHRLPTCHFDRTLGTRVTPGHRDDCTTPDTHQACIPCLAPHCGVCGRSHATNDHPVSCPSCTGKIRNDLTDTRTLYATLPLEAQEAARDGRPAAAGPIPGGTAQILIGPTVRLPLLRYSRELTKDHQLDDPIPPLAVLAQWEDIWRAHLGHDHATQLPATARWGQRVHAPRRATVGGAIAYLLGQLDTIAQDATGPDFVEFARQIRTVRARLEYAVHDERTPERGVECFDCGDQLERRFRTPKPCKHSTPARAELARWVRLGYPEALTTTDVRAARRPCGACDQGGIEDPRAGLSWECPGCRREYGPGEYATAVRRDLLENGADGDGWTHITMAAEAASTLTGYLVVPGTVRKWAERTVDGKPKVASRLNATGVRLVFWPDVAEAAEAAVNRKIAAERRRRLAS